MAGQGFEPGIPLTSQSDALRILDVLVNFYMMRKVLSSKLSFVRAPDKREY